MNKYIGKLLTGKTQSELAQELKVDRTSINKWYLETQPIPAHIALRIHKHTSGEIKYWELRPDLEKIY